VYLSALEERGLVKSWLRDNVEDPKLLPPRRYYVITPKGLEYLRALEITEAAKI
jgi:DNA-binding PadR family transcriptional regulator